MELKSLFAWKHNLLFTSLAAPFDWGTGPLVFFRKIRVSESIMPISIN